MPHKTRKQIKPVVPNSRRAWFLASRPKTLTGALAPVMVGVSAAWACECFVWQTALLCTLFALLMQIDANLFNDYLDYRNGTDKTDRLGPERACSQGWITPRVMVFGIVLVTIAACATGFPLVLWGGWWMVAIGVACVAGCFLYSLFFSRIALGDILVLLFFGIVPVLATFYLQVVPLHPEVPISQYPPFILWTALAMGLVTDCLLVVNNYRDRDTDLRAGKKTLVTKIGSKATEWLYLLLGVVAVALTFSQTYLVVLYLPLHVFNWRQMVYFHEGRILNAVLSKTAFAILLFAVLYSAGMILEI